MNLISMFNNFKVSTRIWLLAGFAIAGFLIILVTNLITGSMQDTARNVSDNGTSLQMTQARVEVSSLLVRRREKDFFLRLDAKYIDRYNNDMDETIEWLGEAKTYTKENSVETIIVKLEDILQRHRAQFNKVANMWIDAGLTTEDGLYASMQEAVHGIEDAREVKNNNALTVKMLMMRRHEKDLMLRVAIKDNVGQYSNGPKYVARVSDRHTEFLEILNNSNLSNTVKADLTAKLAAYVDAFNRYARIRMNLVTEIIVLSDVYAETDQPFAALKAAAQTANQEGNAEFEKASSLASTLSLLITVIFGIISTIVAFLAIKTIVKPVADLEVSLGVIAGGDYESAVPGTSSKDELGSMARAVEGLRDGAKQRVILEEQARQQEAYRVEQERIAVEREQEEERAKNELDAVAVAHRQRQANKVEVLISGFDQNIKEVINTLQASSTQMRSTASSMVEIADNTGVQAASVSTASEEMRENVSTMAAAVEEFSASIREANTQVQSAAVLSRGAVQATEEGARSIEQLSEASGAIEAVVNMINDIAEQTNLLALNATIEAARAGDAGKGFAVVASEVKSLATQTGNATEDIKKQITEMQNMSAGAVEAIAGIKEAIVNLNGVMLGISSAIEEQEAATSEISRSVQFTSDGTTKVSEEIGQVSINAKLTGTSSNEVMDAASELESISSIISSEVESFLRDVKAIQAEA